MRPLLILPFLLLPCLGQERTPAAPGKTMDIRPSAKQQAEEAKAKKAREQKLARLEALKQARAAELAQAYAQEQQRQEALKAAKAPTVGVLSLGGATPTAAPALAPASAGPPAPAPRTPEELLAVLRALALPQDEDRCRWEVVSFDGRTLVLLKTGGNYRTRFRIPLAEVAVRPKTVVVNGALRVAPALEFDSRAWRIALTTTYDVGSDYQGKENLVVLPVRDPAAAVAAVTQYLAQATPKP